MEAIENCGLNLTIKCKIKKGSSEMLLRASLVWAVVTPHHTGTGVSAEAELLLSLVINTNLYYA